MSSAVTQDAEHLLTVQDVAYRLGVPVTWVYAASEAGTLPSMKIGRYVRFHAADITAYIEASRSGPRRE